MGSRLHPRDVVCNDRKTTEEWIRSSERSR